MPDYISIPRPVPTLNSRTAPAESKNAQNNPAKSDGSLNNTHLTDDDSTPPSLFHIDPESSQRQFKVESHPPLNYSITNLTHKTPSQGTPSTNASHDKTRHFEPINIAKWAPLTSPVSKLKVKAVEDLFEPETEQVWKNLVTTTKEGGQRAIAQSVMAPPVIDSEETAPLNTEILNTAPLNTEALNTEALNIEVEEANIIRFANKNAAVITALPSLENIEAHFKSMLNNRINTLVILDAPSNSDVSASAIGSALFKSRKEGNFHLISLPYPYKMFLDEHSHLQRQRVIIKETQGDMLNSIELEILYVHQYQKNALLKPKATNQLAKYINSVATKHQHNGVVWMYEQPDGQTSGTVLGAMALQRHSEFGASLEEIAQSLQQPIKHQSSEPLLTSKEQLDTLVKVAKRHRVPIDNHSTTPVLV